MKIVQLTPEFVRRFNEQERELEELRLLPRGQTQSANPELQNENAKLVADVTQLKEVLAGQKQDAETVVREFSVLQKENEKLKTTLKAQESELLKIRMERDTALKEKQTLNADRKKLQEQLSKHDSAGQVGDSEDIGFLKSEISDKNKQLEELKLKNALQAMQISKLKG